jgi:hypothetical protein
VAATSAAAEPKEVNVVCTGMNYSDPDGGHCEVFSECDGCGQCDEHCLCLQLAVVTSTTASKQIYAVDLSQK